MLFVLKCVGLVLCLFNLVVYWCLFNDVLVSVVFC